MNLIIKYAKDKNGYFTKENIEVPNNHLEIFKKSLAIREIQTKNHNELLPNIIQ